MILTHCEIDTMPQPWNLILKLHMSPTLNLFFYMPEFFHFPPFFQANGIDPEFLNNHVPGSLNLDYIKFIRQDNFFQGLNTVLLNSFRNF